MHDNITELNRGSETPISLFDLKSGGELWAGPIDDVKSANMQTASCHISNMQNTAAVDQIQEFATRRQFVKTSESRLGDSGGNRSTDDGHVGCHFVFYC
jgi:hypothetical protein